MALTTSKAFIDEMTTVLSFTTDNLTSTDKKKFDKDCEKAVDEKVTSLLTECRQNQIKFVDPDFGPTDDDDVGAIAMYGNPPVRPGATGASQYPDPAKLRWSRPNYKQVQRKAKSGDDNEEAGDDDDDDDASEDDDNDYDDRPTPLCEDGQLFVDGTSSGDVIQGSLGDCWFLGSLAVLATRPTELEDVFWRGDMYRDCGLFVCKFFKDNCWKYVIIDDRLPVYDNKNAGLVFSKCRDPNELWVPLIEKAYAKLHGCYKSLIGGYVHYGLADLTGRQPRLIVTHADFPGFVSDEVTAASGLNHTDPDRLWTLLTEYKQWDCLLGCSIQVPPSSNKEKKPEAEAGQGLRMMHAYSLVDIGQVTTASGSVVKLVRLRNPWGFGEWTGAWSDESDERQQNDAAIKRVFDVSASEATNMDSKDGTFFMAFSDWLLFYTHVFIAIRFPKSWSGVRIRGRWDDESGGNRSMATWSANPKIMITIGNPTASTKSLKRVFLSISIPDFRLVLGDAYYRAPLAQVPISFDIISTTTTSNDKTTMVINGSAEIKYKNDAPTVAGSVASNQPPYYFASVQTDLYLQEGSYYIVPSTYKRQIVGEYFLCVHCEDSVTSSSSSFSVVASESIDEEEKGPSMQNQQAEVNKSLARRFEELKEDLQSQALSLKLSQSIIIKELTHNTNNNKSKTNNKVTMMDIKKKLSNLGLAVSSLKIDDVAYLLDDCSQYDDRSMFDLTHVVTSLFKEESMIHAPPEPPEDDLKFTPADLGGMLHVKIVEGKSLRQPTSWTDYQHDDDDDNDVNVMNDRNVIDVKLYEVLVNNARRKWVESSTTSTSRKAMKEKYRQSSLAAANKKTRPVMSSNDDDDEMLLVPEYDDDESLMLETASPDRKSKTQLVSTPMKDLLSKDDIDDKSNIHSTDFFKRIESKRSQFFSVNRSNVRRGFLCIDCGRTGTEFQCTRKSCNNGFCFDCWTKLPVSSKLCENCFDSVSTLTNSNQVVAVSKPTNVLEESKTDMSNTFVSLLIDSMITTACLMSEFRVRPIIKDLAEKGEISSAKSQHSMSSKKSLISSKKSLYDNASIKGNDETKTVKNVHQMSKHLKASPREDIVQKSFSRLPSQLTISGRESMSHPMTTFSKITGRGGSYKFHSLRPIYRRLVPIQCIDNSNQSTDDAYMKWFCFFDKDGNGEISFAEFKSGLKDLNLKLSEEEGLLLMKRFDADNNDGSINVKEFKSFFCGKNSVEKSDLSMESLLVRLKFNPKLVQYSKNKPKTQVVVDHPDECMNSIFMSTSKSNIDQSTDAINEIAEECLVTRNHIARLFSVTSYNINTLMNIITDSVDYKSVPSCIGKLDAVQFEETCLALVENLREQLYTKSSHELSMKDGISPTWSSATTSYMQQLADQSSRPSSKTMLVPVRHIIDYLMKETMELLTRKPNLIAMNSVGDSIQDLSAVCEVVAVCAVDRIVQSNWNIAPDTDSVSYMGFCSFVFHDKLRTVEQKLRVAMKQSIDISKPSILHLVSVYLDSKKKSLVFDIYDPFSGAQYIMQFDNGFSFLKWPVGSFSLQNSRLQPNSIDIPTYTKELDPAENEVITRLCSQLNLVNVGANKEIRLVEGERFLTFIRKLFSDISLPFFVFLSSTELCFLTKSNESTMTASLRKIVFGALKQHSSISSFLRNCQTSLRVVLKKYDSQETDSMNWKEFSSHLSSTRSPYAAVEILPHVTQTDDAFPELIDSFISPSSRLESSTDSSPGLDGNKNAIAEIQLQQTQCDEEGGSFPIWNSKLLFSVQPPKYLSKQVLTSDIHRMLVDGVVKFVVVMARDWGNGQIFGTVYDPKTAKDYLLIGTPSLWKTIGYYSADENEEKVQKPSDSRLLSQVDKDLYDDLVSDLIASQGKGCNVQSEPFKRLVEKESRRWLNGSVTLSDVQRQISMKSLNGKLHIGPCITPAIVIGLYNRLPKSSILIGSCQLSLSSALSASGVLHKHWVTITDANSNENGRLMIEYTFNRGETEDDKQQPTNVIKEEKVVPKVEKVVPKVEAVVVKLEKVVSREQLISRPASVTDLSQNELEVARKALIKQKEEITEMQRKASDFQRIKLQLEREKQESITKQQSLEKRLEQEKEEFRSLQLASNNLRKDFNNLVNVQEEKSKQSPTRSMEDPPTLNLSLNDVIRSLASRISEAQLSELSNTLSRMNGIYHANNLVSSDRSLPVDTVMQTWSLVTASSVDSATVSALKKHLGSADDSIVSLIDFKTMLQSIATNKNYVLPSTTATAPTPRKINRVEEVLSSRESESQAVSAKKGNKRNHLNNTWSANDKTRVESVSAPDNSNAIKESESLSNTLPVGWEARTAPNGNTYYIDHNSRVTTWVSPLQKEEEKSLSSRVKAKTLSNDKTSESKSGTLRSESSQQKKRNYN